MSQTSVEAPDIVDTAEDILHVEDPHFHEGSVALVTGGASGIGQATAVTLAANGLTVVATDIDEAGLAETVAYAEELDVPGTVEPVEGNLADDADIEGVVGEATTHGELKYVANVAGMQHIASIAEFPMDQYDLMQDVMVRAPLYLTQLAWPHIEASEGGVGAVGNMCSVHGHYATQDKVAYNAAKFGLRGLTQSIAAEGEGRIRGFSVSVGYVKTPLVANQIEDTAESRGITPQAVIEEVMLGQARTKEMMLPVEVANLFVMGFSKHGKHLNGGDLLWDGGYTTTYE